MKSILLGMIIVFFAFVATGNTKAKEISSESEHISNQVKHSKRKVIKGKVVTRADYVKTSNPKRLHWNKIHEKNNLTGTKVINCCPKRKNLVRLLSLEKKAGNLKGNFHKQRKRHKSVS